jgi:hypothetical protein
VPHSTAVATLCTLIGVAGTSPAMTVN